MKAHAIAIMLGTLLISGCSKHEQPGASGSAVPLEVSRSGLPGSAPWSGHVLRGDDANALRNYLRTVQEVKATVFQVQWNPATVPIDREAAIRSLRQVSRDGGTFVFAADEPAVQKLKPGSILWVRDLALRKVDAVNTQGGLTTVQTSVVSLNEAMPNARIEFEAPVPVQNFVLSHREFPKTAANPPKSSLSHHPYVFVPALYTVPAGGSAPPVHSTGAPPPGSAPSAGATHPGSTPIGDAGSVGGSTGGGGNPIGDAGNVGSSTGGGGSNPIGDAGSVGSSTGAGGGSSPIGDAGSVGSSVGGGGANPGTATGDGAPSGGSAPGGGAPYAGSTPGGGAPNAGSAPGGAPSAGAPNAGSAPGGGAPSAGDVPGSGGDPADQKDEQSFGDNAYNGSLNGMQYSIGYLPKASGALSVTLESRDAEDGGDSGGGKAFKHLFETASDNVDVRFKVQADLSGFSAAGAYQIVSGNTTAAKLQFKNLKGHVTAAFVGRLGQPGNKGLKIPMMHLPISFTVPLPIEGIPFVVQLGGDFLLSVFLAGNHATLSVNGAYDFSGQSGLTYTNGGLTDNTSLSGAPPAVTNYQGASLGVSAVMLAAQLPRIGFGLSVTGAASTIAFIDVVHVLTMTQAADAGAMMLTPRCKRITYNAVGHVGVETQILVLPVPAVQQWASDKLSGKKEVFNQSKEVLDPPVKGCEVN